MNMYVWMGDQKFLIEKIISSSSYKWNK
jgi:hypothetical protein